jgi:PAS domain S-box-containing protein
VNFVNAGLVGIAHPRRPDMEEQWQDPAQEVKHLQRFINDLISLLALPATWIGSEPSRIVSSVLDGLLNMLNLDFIYVRLDSSGEALEFLRASSTWEVMPQPEEVGKMVRSWLGDGAQNWSETVRRTFKQRELSLLSLQLGLQGETGIVVAGSGRIDFPRQTERLVLNIAASQAAIGLKEAHLLHHQRQLAKELDQRVAQRTSELSAANEELRETRAALQKALDEIRKSEAKLRQVIDTIPTLAWCNLPDGPNEFLNKGWHEYTGLSPEESHGWGWQVAFHPDDLPPLMERWQKMLASGEPDEIEARLRRHDGVYRWFLIRAQAFRDDSGKIMRWYGTSTDIEDRKRAEQALAGSERNLRLIINTMPALTWSARADGSVDFVNQRWLDYTGLSQEQALGWGWAQAFHAEDLGRLNEYWLSIVASGRPGEIEARLRRSDGRYRWFLFRAGPLRDESGAIVKWYGTNTDIDDRKRTEEELRIAQSELARVTRVMMMGQLTASIAHEVNQPLSGIVTNASTCLRMLSANPPNIEGARETVRRTIRDGNRASDVITRLRTLYSKKEPALESMDLNDAAREVTALSSTEIQRNGVTLQQQYSDDLPPAFGDRIQLQQVILNLLRNAVDAMSTLDDRPRELLLRTERDEGNLVRLSVRDSGVGLTPEAADKIFQAFYTTKTDGMGIGLSISRSIIEAHQGRLWASLNDGPGCTFSFAIPCKDEDAKTQIDRSDSATNAA